MIRSEAVLLATGTVLLAACTFDHEDAFRCTNGVQDGSETRVDCGGDCLACFGDPCQTASDCLAGTCEGGRCNAPPSKTRRAWKTIVTNKAGPTSRYGAGLAVLGSDGRNLVLTGGYGGGGYKTDTWVLTDTKFAEHISAPQRVYFGFVHRGTGGPIAIGGQENNTTLRNDVLAWDDATAGWVAVAGAPALPEPRAHFAAAYAPASADAAGRTFVFGGITNDPDGATSADLLVLEDAPGAAWKRMTRNAASAPWPSNRYDHAMAFDSRVGLLVLFGGRSSAAARSELDDTWLYDGATFSRLDGPGPSKRRGHVMAYDEDARRIVLFGGSNGEPLSDTWEFDAEAKTWSEMHPVTNIASIGQAWGAAMAYEPARHRSVMFGGQTSSTAVYEYLVFGNACTQAADCGSGVCANGVCCDAECTPGICNATETLGVCLQ